MNHEKSSYLNPFLMTLKILSLFAALLFAPLKSSLSASVLMSFAK
jgi:hypothetical protein